ncbi:hypothetical protein ACFPRL_15845 [Pseudoclavibacter helvolus]
MSASCPSQCSERRPSGRRQPAERLGWRARRGACGAGRRRASRRSRG